MNNTIKRYLDREYTEGEQNWKFLFLYHIVSVMHFKFPEDVKISGLKIELEKRLNNDRLSLEDFEPLPRTLNLKDTAVQQCITNLSDFVDIDIRENYILSDDENFNTGGDMSLSSFDNSVIFSGKRLKLNINGKSVITKKEYSSTGCIPKIFTINNLNPHQITGATPFNLSTAGLEYTIDTKVTNLPERVLYYIWIDTNGLTPAQFEPIQHNITDWYEGVKNSNTLLVSNAFSNESVPDQDIHPDAVGFVKADILTGIDVDNNESFLNSPLNAILKWRKIEGGADFTDFGEVTQYAKDKAIVCINFTSIATNRYVEETAEFTSSTISTYARDFSIMTQLVLSTNYHASHVVHVGTAGDLEINNVELLSILAAIHHRPLTNTELEGLIGTAKYTAITQQLPNFFKEVRFSNPFTKFTALEELNFSADYSYVHTGAYNTFRPGSYIESNFSNRHFYYEKEELSYSVTPYGTQYNTHFEIQLSKRDIVSNKARVDISFCAECTEALVCEDSIKTIGVLRSGYIYSKEDFLGAEDDNYIKIFTPESSIYGFFLHRGFKITEDIVIHVDNLNNLTFNPTHYGSGTKILPLTYKVSKDGLNYCTDTSRLINMKVANADTLETLSLVIPPKSITGCSSTSNYSFTLLVDATFTYSGDHDNLSYLWFNSAGNPINTDFTVADFDFTVTDIYTLEIVDIFGNKISKQYDFELDYLEEITSNFPTENTIAHNVTNFNIANFLMQDPENLYTNNIWWIEGPSANTVTIGQGLFQTDINASRTFVNIQDPGNYTITTRIYDTCNRQTDISITLIKEYVPGQTPPTITILDLSAIHIIGTDGAFHTPNITVVDIENDLDTVTWQQTQGYDILNIDTTTSNITPIISGFANPGNYVFKITATDVNSNQSIKYYTLTVSN